MDMGVEIEFFPLQFEEKDWQLRSPVDRFEKVWMSWRLPPLQRRKNIFVPMVSLKLPRVAIECLKLSQMFVALIVAMTRHSMVGQQSHASVFRPCFDQFRPGIFHWSFLGRLASSGSNGLRDPRHASLGAAGPWSSSFSWNILKHTHPVVCISARRCKEAARVCSLFIHDVVVT